jgi:hypothetical protein
MIKPYDQIFKKKSQEAKIEHLDLLLDINFNDQPVVSALSQVFSDSLSKITILKSSSNDSMKDLPSMFSEEMLSKVDVRFYLKSEDDWKAALIYPENIVEITVDKDLFEKDKNEKEKAVKLKKFVDL